MSKKLVAVIAASACAVAAMAFAPPAACAPTSSARSSTTSAAGRSSTSRLPATARVTCSNGQSMPVQVSAKAVGLTAGKWQIDNGKGNFTDVHKHQ